MYCDLLCIHAQHRKPGPNCPPDHRAELWPHTQLCSCEPHYTRVPRADILHDTGEKTKPWTGETKRATAVRGRDCRGWSTGARNVHLTPYGHGGRGGWLNKLLFLSEFGHVIMKVQLCCIIMLTLAAAHMAGLQVPGGCKCMKTKARCSPALYFVVSQWSMENHKTTLQFESALNRHCKWGIAVNWVKTEG